MLLLLQKITTSITGILFLMLVSGCSLVPDIRHQPQFHNPFPQLRRIAILPFQNQSDDPTLSGHRVALAYYDEMQAIPGFEVIPMGVIENELRYFEQDVLERPIGTIEDFQRLARHLHDRMDVDAVLQGSITDFESYYPPRMTMKVNWYAAHPGFHKIPVGYGLPWGTKKEKKIPEWIRLESERELATEQLKTQTPEWPAMETNQMAQNNVLLANLQEPVDPVENARIPTPDNQPSLMDELPPAISGVDGRKRSTDNDRNDESSPPREWMSGETEVPFDWPDPQGFIPPAPSTQRPTILPQFDPIISHMKAYRGNDNDFTAQLAEYYYFQDDQRIGGWKAYLQRSEDFIRFCCHLHVTETLAGRGGQLDSRLILRWPIDRYER